MKLIVLITLITLRFYLVATTQTPTDLNKVEFEVSKLSILRVSEDQQTAVFGKLSTGESVKCGCEDGDCYFRIEYKGRIIQMPIELASLFEVYEYDFGGDGDKELVLLSYSEYSPGIIIVSYSKGNSSLMLHEEISSEKTIIRQNYIECLDETGLPSKVWHYYKGVFWEMAPVSYD
jgi:hypothetical protein